MTNHDKINRNHENSRAIMTNKEKRTTQIKKKQ